MALSSIKEYLSSPGYLGSLSAYSGSLDLKSVKNIFNQILNDIHDLAKMIYFVQRIQEYEKHFN